MNDEQSTGWNNPPLPSDEHGSDVPNTAQTPASEGVTRRSVLWWAGVGGLTVATLGAGAVAVYASQATGEDAATSGGRRPPGSPSGMPRGERRPLGARPSGMRTGARPSGAPTPSDAPSSGG